MIKHYATYLQPGDVVDMGPVEGHCVVEMVNDCRARVRPTRRVRVEFEPSTTGKKVEFIRPSGTFNISPNSELPIVRREKIKPRSRAVR